MPLGGMEAPADVNQYTEAHWRRCPAKPVTVLIDFTNPPRPPVKPHPAYKPHRKQCAPSEWPRQGYAAVVAYLRVSGPYGPLTGVS